MDDEKLNKQKMYARASKEKNVPIVLIIVNIQSLFATGRLHNHRDRDKKKQNKPFDNCTELR